MTGPVSETLRYPSTSDLGRGVPKQLPSCLFPGHCVLPWIFLAHPKEWGFSIRQSWICIRTLSLTSCVSLGKSLNVSESQLPHLNLERLP